MWRVKPVRIEDDPEHLDIFTFLKAERFKVHEDRTEAELCSAVVRGSVRQVKNGT